MQSREPEVARWAPLICGTAFPAKPYRNRRGAGTFTAMDTATLVGFFAAFCTSVSYVPQLKKCWETGKAEDLSLMMFSVLATGVAAWIVYGIFKKDIVIIIANALSLSCLAGILWFKLREDRPRRSSSKHQGADFLKVKSGSTKPQIARE
ncbi:hypothetical protein NWI01_35000 [Nitrobacter winogradskyi]|uniref:MtN3 and saliva related transmembrane protein n=2 Tax=Nitrobacter winogradskyi TaxID=913 RepID=A0A4Y3WGF2_NITWI|nr:hypothetical protein NWI01_35000 [Nitrobacter winogradskyi]